MKDSHVKTQAQRSAHESGLHNDFSEQEATMTNSAMPPEFALTAGDAANPSGDKPADDPKPKLTVPGVPAEFMSLLDLREGIRWKVYKDSKGHLTAGMGHKLTKAELGTFKEHDRVTQQQVEAWAASDVPGAWQAAQSQMAELGIADDEFCVYLASVNYQLGVYWNDDHENTWALMKEHKWMEAADEAANSDWYHQTKTRVEDFQKGLRELAVRQGQPGATTATATAAGGDVHTLHRNARGKGQADALKAGLDKSKQKPAATAATQPPKGREGMKLVQQRLQALGLYDGKIDGIATSSKGESKTVAGIKTFQMQRGLPVTGTVDAATWAALQGAKPGMMEQFWAHVEGVMKEAEGKPQEQDSELVTPWDKFMSGADKSMGLSKGLPPTNSAAFEASEGGFVDPKYFVGQKITSGPHKGTIPGDASCRYASTDIVSRYLLAEMPEMAEELGATGVNTVSMSSGYLRIVEEDKSHKPEVPLDPKEAKNFNNEEWLDLHDENHLAIDYIVEKLSQKVPVVVGVDHTYNRPGGGKPASREGVGYNEGTTDHFITLTGMGVDAAGKRYFSYFEVGTSHVDKGTDQAKNRLVEESPGIFCRKRSSKGAVDGAGASGNQDYYLSMVLIFEPDRQRFQSEIKENNKDKATLFGEK